MKRKVVIQPRAIEDIKRNALWWADRHSAEQALAWYDDAIDSLNALAEFAESHSLSVENEDFSFEIRDCLFGLGKRKSYRGIFTIDSDVVRVLTVRRSSERPFRPDEA